MNDFNDRPLVADSITGLRSFKVDKLGRLTGVSYQSVFKPGVNTAECVHHRVRARINTAAAAGGYVSSGYGEAITRAIAQMQQQIYTSANWSTLRVTTKPEAAPAKPVTPVSLVKKPKHRVANVDCTCGYYAYFDTGENPYHDDTDQVIGVVRGSGTVTVGSRGFRAEKATLVALVRPDRSKLYDRPGDRMANWLYQFNSTPLTLGLFGGVGSLLTFFASFSNDAPTWLRYVAPVGVILGALISYLCFRGVTVHFDKIEHAEIPDAISTDLIERNYPDVPIYSSVKAALAAHPLTPPLPPVAPSPDNDPEFWTRAVPR